MKITKYYQTLILVIKKSLDITNKKDLINISKIIHSTIIQRKKLIQ